MAELINEQEQIHSENDDEIPEEEEEVEGATNVKNLEGATNVEDVEEEEDNIADDDDYDGDIEQDENNEEINNETCALFLKQIWDAQRNCIQKRKQDRFLPLTKKFINSGFIKREKMLNDNPQLIKHMIYLCRNIANGKIPTDISSVDKALFSYISDRTTPREDVHLRILEEFSV
ncbi:Hypothetical predicted protein [Paramuricea clavata]|uniref:Uncharacterized protein n=1 Tax=Paramuricea clavata TaxID=317549 RepID=A0A7D9H7G5_PARCT|nr:Hypothetical predicted protein [Paramuricea clavata]